MLKKREWNIYKIEIHENSANWHFVSESDILSSGKKTNYVKKVLLERQVLKEGWKNFIWHLILSLYFFLFFSLSFFFSPSSSSSLLIYPWTFKSLQLGWTGWIVLNTSKCSSNSFEPQDWERISEHQEVKLLVSICRPSLSSKEVKDIWEKENTGYVTSCDLRINKKNRIINLNKYPVTIIDITSNEVEILLDCFRGKSFLLLHYLFIQCVHLYCDLTCKG